METIDWNVLWKESRQKRTWQGKTREDWDQRSAGFARRNTASHYTQEFLRRLTLRPEMTVLDMGCGPGTLAIPLAHQVKRVTAVDFSSEMLNHLAERSAQEGITNIESINGAWEDDWRALGIGTYDLVIASRSLAVDDLRGALTKLNAAAKELVIIGDRVGHGPFDPALFHAVGREFVPGPDYIYTINILYQMGIHARLDFIEIQEPKCFESRQAAIDSCAWMLHQLTPEEQPMVDRYFDRILIANADGSFSMTSQVQTQWAVISFSPVPTTTHKLVANL
ncbi:MAG: class I SAM-dependent methyltransferase [Desulfobulbaceae bacterium]|nr:class I SAM-dependent methyltransferase [Desulfobulbaceae bacterium]